LKQGLGNDNGHSAQVVLEEKSGAGENTILHAPKKGWPSLFCFSVMQPDSDEQVLLEALLARRLGIFACDATQVVSSKRVRLGPESDSMYTTSLPPEIWTHKLGDPSKHPWHATTSWLNAGVFMVAYEFVVGGDEIFEYDWLVKADPDAVLFPDRLRKHLGKHTPEGGSPLYLLNCNKRGDEFVVDQDSDHGGSLYGALEVFSMEAMRIFKEKDGKKTCEGKLHWQGWGEDFFMSECMDLLGVPNVSDFYLVGDERCNPESCKDGWRAAFHPFKDPESYIKCWEESAGKID